MNRAPLKLAASLSLTLLGLSLLSNARVSFAQTKPAPLAEAISPIETELLAELNLMRARPAEYAAYLEQLKPYFRGMDYHCPGTKALTTMEGWAAVEEAIVTLRATKPLPPLELSRGMCSGAGELVRDQHKSGATGHKGSDGSFCEQRMTRFGTWSGPIGENLSYGNHSSRERVLNLLIDDGVANRGHRKRLLDPTYKVAGVSCGEHSAMGAMCVITLAGSFSEKAKAPPSSTTKKAVTPQAPKRAMRF